MAFEEIGENLVGAYLRYVEGFEFVVYNTRPPGVQTEIDVVGLKLEPARQVVFCEVATHLGGLEYGRGYADSAQRLQAKIKRAAEYAQVSFAGWDHRFEIWSPVVPAGLVKMLDQARDDLSREGGLDAKFVINEAYTERIQRLIDHARGSMASTSEPAYRLLQLLAHLRGRLTL